MWNGCGGNNLNPMGEQMSIHPACRSDLDTVMKIESSCFISDAFNHRQFSYLINSRHATVKIIYEDGPQPEAPIGHFITLLSHLHNGVTKGRVYSLCVLPSHQGRGYGKTALEAMREYFSAIRASYVTIECDAENPRLIRLYESAGFRVTERLTNYYSDGDAVRMRGWEI
jgi:[ribosomal protein S18]-alanine N-acetyltransferase